MVVDREEKEQRQRVLAAAAQQREAAELAARAADDPTIAHVLTAAHRRLQLWRLCARKCCRRARSCRGDALACAARHWPVACSCMDDIAGEGRRGRAARFVAGRQLARWSEQDGALTRKLVTLIGWSSTFEQIDTERAQQRKRRERPET